MKPKNQWYQENQKKEKRKEMRNAVKAKQKPKPKQTKQNKTLRNLWLKNILATKPSKFELIKPPQK